MKDTPHQFILNVWVKSSVMVELPDVQQPVLGIRYVFQNLTETRKLDLTSPFIFQLKDEFGNQYRQLSKPENYAEIRALPKNFPSVYPNEEMEEVIFFEPPIERSRFLTLSINAQNIGLKGDVSLIISLDKIKGISQSINDSTRSEKNALSALGKPIEPLHYSPIKIVTPTSGVNVSPGDRITVEVKIEDETLRPDALMLIIPDYVLEDPNVQGTYDLIVPKTQTGDFPLVVIAKWRKGDSEELTSDSILLNVVDPSVL